MLASTFEKKSNEKIKFPQWHRVMLSFSKGNHATLWKAEVVVFFQSLSTANIVALQKRHFGGEVCHIIHVILVRKVIYAATQLSIQNCQ